MTIHHATAKRAARLGFILAETIEGFQFARLEKGALVVYGRDESAKAALAQAEANHAAGTPIETLEATRSNLATTMAKYRHTYIDETCGDDIAAALVEATTGTNDEGRRCLDKAALRRVCDANGLDLGRWGHLNNGQMRMCAGNALRGMFRRGETVVVGKARFVPVEADEAVA